MDLTMKSLSLYAAVTLTGLSAGLFYAWAVSVIPGTQKVADPTYLETMQAINRAILNPSFYLSFFGSLIMLVVASFYHYQSPGFGLILAAATVYLVGTFGVTVFGNVPLNDQLDLLELVDLSPTRLAQFRQDYENRWNRFHAIRTLFSIISFLLALAAVFSAAKG